MTKIHANLALIHFVVFQIKWLFVGFFPVTPQVRKHTHTRALTSISKETNEKLFHIYEKTSNWFYVEEVVLCVDNVSIFISTFVVVVVVVVRSFVLFLLLLFVPFKKCVSLSRPRR